MATIIYQTNTGSSQQYAEMLAEKTSFTALPLSKSAEVSEDEEIIFIGWIMGGTIQGLTEVKEKFRNIKCICGVGMMFTDKTKNEITEKNKISVPLFLLHGNFHMDRLKGMYKMMMSMAVKMIKGKLKETGGPDADKMIDAFENGIDMVSEDRLDPVIEFINS